MDRMRAFRDALGCFATGICVVTCRTLEGMPHGVTVNSFSSVSLDPPLVLFSLDRANNSFAHFHAAERFAINVLSAQQESLSRGFARTTGDRFDGVAYDVGLTGAPLLPGSLAVFECAKHAAHSGGDHEIIIGRVLDFACLSDAESLLYYRGRYRYLSPTG